MALIDNLIKGGWLKTPRIIEAFQKIKRADFLPDNLKDSAELDEALPIGFSQTISQPLVVAFMLELLQPQEGNKVLDIGSGSGWTSALLAELVGESGQVTAVELIPELKEFGQRNAAKYDFKNLEFICANASKGYEKEAPYDRILASAAAPTGKARKEGLPSLISAKEEVPEGWKKQLKPLGRIVAPIDSSIWQIVGLEKGKFEEIEYPGFVFVPLVE